MSWTLRIGAGPYPVRAARGHFLRRTFSPSRRGIHFLSRDQSVEGERDRPGHADWRPNLFGGISRSACGCRRARWSPSFSLSARKRGHAKAVTIQSARGIYSAETSEFIRSAEFIPQDLRKVRAWREVARRQLTLD